MKQETNDKPLMMTGFCRLWSEVCVEIPKLWIWK